MAFSTTLPSRACLQAQQPRLRSSRLPFTPSKLSPSVSKRALLCRCGLAGAPLAICKPGGPAYENTLLNS